MSLPPLTAPPLTAAPFTSPPLRTYSHSNFSHSTSSHSTSSHSTSSHSNSSHYSLLTLQVDMCILTSEELKRKEEEAAEAEDNAAGHASALEAKVTLIEERVADSGAAAAAVEAFLSHGPGWALGQEEVVALLQKGRLLTDPLVAALDSDSIADDEGSAAGAREKNKSRGDFRRASASGAARSYTEADAAAFLQRQSDALNRAGHSANSEEFDPPRALRFFAAAHALVPRTPILLSAANMLSKVGDCGEAAEMYRRVLALPGVKRDQKEMAQRKLRESEGMIASNREALSHLYIELEEAKARVPLARSAALSSLSPSSPGRKLRQSDSSPLLSDGELLGLHSQHARSLVLSSSAKRMERLLETFASPIGPLAVCELLREMLGDLKIEADYFGPALAKYTDEVYKIALMRRADLLLKVGRQRWGRRGRGGVK